jgi:hypothetical protein
VVVLVASLPIIPVLVIWQQRPLWQYNTSGTANAVAISSDGSVVAVGVQTGTKGGEVLLFDRAGSLLWSRTIDRAISSISISDNASYIVASGFQLIGSAGIFYENGAVYYFGRDGTQLWNYTTSPDVYSRDFSLPIFGSHLSDDGSRVIAQTAFSVFCLDQHGMMLWNYNSTGTNLIHVATSSDASRVAVADAQLRLLSGQGRTLWNSTRITNLVQSLVITPDAKYVAVGTAIDGNHGTLYLFNNTGSLLWSRAEDSNPSSIAFSGDESRIVFGTNYHIVSYTIQGDQVWSFSAPPAVLAANLDGSYVLAGLWSDWTQSILVIDGQGQVVWGKPAGEIHGVALSADGSNVVVAGGPPDTGPFSFNSAAVYCLPSPRTLVANTGSLYSTLYFIPTIDIIPAASLFLLIPVAGLVLIIVKWWLKTQHHNKEPPIGEMPSLTTQT